jgi:hypothetical protein
VLKESWRYGERPSEGELLERAKNAGVKGIAIHLAHCDHEEIVYTILGPCREASPAKAGPGAEAIIIPNRFRTLVVMSRGRAITQFGTTLELLRNFRDAIRSHHSLLTTGDILHRDVSINNIMITHPSYPRPDGLHGFLIDLDLAIAVNSSGIPCGAPHCTGTYKFFSTENLRAESGFAHTFHDDLQSFFLGPHL